MLSYDKYIQGIGVIKTQILTEMILILVLKEKIKQKVSLRKKTYCLSIRYCFKIIA